MDNKHISKKLLATLNGEVFAAPPFWFMRQAGRYLPEYRELRAKAGSFLNLCFNPDYAAEVTLQPIRRFNMDAAILFADILLVPAGLGQKVDFVNGEGPQLSELVIDALHFDESKLQPIYETLKKLRTSEILADKTLIGFSGSPWTVATYMVEGGSSRSFTKTKEFSKKPEFAKLIDILVESTSKYLISQIKAGAEVLQIFDSWAGALEGADFDKWVIEPNARIVANVKAYSPKTPIIGFPKGTKELQKFCKHTKVDALSIDSSVDIGWALNNIDAVIQGNLNQEILLGEKADIKREAEKIIKAAAGKPFIFNLGHGIIKETLVENIEFLSNFLLAFGQQDN